MDPGEHVDCTAGPDDDLLVTRYGGLRGITSVDIHFRGQIVGTDQLIQTCSTTTNDSGVAAFELSPKMRSGAQGLSNSLSIDVLAMRSDLAA